MDVEPLMLERRWDGRDWDASRKDRSYIHIELAQHETVLTCVIVGRGVLLNRKVVYVKDGQIDAAEGVLRLVETVREDVWSSRAEEISRKMNEAQPLRWTDWKRERSIEQILEGRLSQVSHRKASLRSSSSRGCARRKRHRGALRGSVPAGMGSGAHGRCEGKAFLIITELH